MPTFGSLLKKKKTHSTGSKELSASSTATGAEASTTSAPDKPADETEHSKESNDSHNSVGSTGAETSNNSHTKSNSHDNQMTLTSSTNQQNAQGANNSSSHHHHHLPNIGSIKSIINPTHHQHGNETQGQGHAESNNNNNSTQNYAQTSQQQGQVSKSQAARTTKGKYSLEDFSLQRTLGTGSFGRVHLVQSRHNHRFYAIKVLKKAQVVKMKQVEHTNDERRMLQRVKHPFLITLWGTFQDSKNLYMVMDFVEGGELFSLLRKSQVRPLRSWAVVRNGLTDCRDFLILWLNSMLRKSHWLWSICMHSILYTEISSPRTCCWTGMGI
jgi:protein kinase A